MITQKFMFTLYYAFNWLHHKLIFGYEFLILDSLRRGSCGMPLAVAVCFSLQLCPSLGSSSKYDHHLHIRNTSYCRTYNLWNSDQSYHTYSRSLLHRIFRSASSCTFHTTWFHLFLLILRICFLCWSLKIPHASSFIQLELSPHPSLLSGSRHS